MMFFFPVVFNSSPKESILQFDHVRFLSTMNTSFLRQLVESQAHTKLASLVHGKVFFDLPLEQRHFVMFNHVHIQIHIHHGQVGFEYVTVQPCEIHAAGCYSF